jgi:DNA repair photolyase
MITKPLYTPAGRAREYGDLACNIYTGCNHGCAYCYAPAVLRKTREEFAKVEPRRDIVESVKRQIVREGIAGKRIHLCFMCDPYPAEIDTTATREVIRAIKESGNHVQILTKGGYSALRGFDLLDENDWFGVTITGAPRALEPNAASSFDRLGMLEQAKYKGLHTWASCEPVLNPAHVLAIIRREQYIDLFRIGKLNHHMPEDFGLAPDRALPEAGEGRE